MALEFDGSTHTLTLGSAVVAAYPFTLACRFWPDINNAFKSLLGLHNTAVNEHSHYIGLTNAGGGRAVSVITPTQGIASAGGTINVGQWNSLVGRFTSATSRDCVLNNGTPGTNATNLALGAVNHTQFSGIPYGSGARFDGKAAELVIWNVAVPDWVIREFHNGVSPLLLLPQNVVAYWPLDEASGRNYFGSGHFTLNGSPTVFTPAPGIIRPTAPQPLRPTMAVRQLQGNFSAGEAEFSAVDINVRVQLGGDLLAQFASTLPFEAASPIDVDADISADFASVSAALTNRSHIQGAVQAQSATMSGFAGTVTTPFNAARFRQWWIGLKLRQGGGQVHMPLIFTDAFTGTLDEALETRPGWTRIDGISGGAKINNANQLKNTTATDTAYQAPSTGTPNHYAQAKAGSGYQSGGILPFGPCVRVQNKDNWIGVRCNGANIELYKRVGGTFTQLFAVTQAVSVNDTIRVEAQGTTVRVFRNGVQVSTDQNVPELTGIETPGLVCRSALPNSWMDDWQSGPL